MKPLPFILLMGVLYLNTLNGTSQDSLLFRGQLSAWMNYNPDNNYPLNSGIRYIPELNNAIQLKNKKLLDFEASANIYGTADFLPFDSARYDGKIKPYRLWARYSTQQFEFRVGLQKINFGSASILRPLMWFDQIDPRDPLKLTDGVWGALARYYFLNNANIWGWVLYGNHETKGWEAIPTKKQVPEFGGRIQIPVPRGEAALSYHHRVDNSRNILNNEFQFSSIPENRIGFDTKLDLVIGCWLEASWTNKAKDVGIYTNQEIMNAGMDYTFGIGNGLTVTFEQLLAAYDEKPFEMNQSVSFSLLSLNYPIGIFDNLNAIIYYDWTNNAAYNFVNWEKQFNNVSLYLMAYINPMTYQIPAQGDADNFYAGKGIQFMFVYNH